MPHTLFIADLHLDKKHQESLQYFTHFIKTQAVKSQALYILGDFFDHWVGDDDRNDFLNEIKDNLLLLTKKNIPVYLLHGNRDFLIGRKFCKQTGCQLLRECNVVDLYGEKILLLHGDQLCTNDIKHMKFRRVTQNSILKKTFLLLPLKFRKKIATNIRQNSRKHHTILKLNELDVVQSEVKTKLQQFKVNRMIHGHIHQPNVFSFSADGKQAERIVLGAWEHQGYFLRWHANGKREMVSFTL